MNEQQLAAISESLEKAVDTLLTCAGLKPGHIFVLGCSTSEVAGAAIGSASNQAIGDCIIDTLMKKLQPLGITLAVGCCEHLNRAVVLPRAAAQAGGYTIVNARPVLHAGGACATAYYERLEDPVLVQSVRGQAGLDIGGTLIGMHLQPVAVPVRGPVRNVGSAHLVMARTRAPYIGGPRTQYLPEQDMG